MDESDFWELDRSARARVATGDHEGAAAIWRQAVRLRTPDRLSAYRHLALHRLRRRETDVGPLIREGLSLAGTSDQRRWWHPDLLFLAGVDALLGGDPGSAEAWLQQAYRERPPVDDVDLLPPWALEVVRRTDTSDHACLSYVKRADSLRSVTIDYEQVLATMPPDTHVVEVGAMDGVRFDTLYDFVTSRGWWAVVVEPIADLHAELVRNYAHCPRVRCVRAAITGHSGEATMLRMKPESIGSDLVGEWAWGVSSLHDTLLRHYPDDVVAERVPALTFDDLVQQERISRIDVLQIDTEGHDWQVLRLVDLARWRPRVVRVEVVNLQPADRLAVFDHLESAGYSLGLTGGDVTAELPRIPS